MEPNQDQHRVVLHPQILDLFPYGCRKPILRRHRNMYIGGADNGNCGFKASQIVRSMGCWRDRAEVQGRPVGLAVEAPRAATLTARVNSTKIGPRIAPPRARHGNSRGCLGATPRATRARWDFSENPDDCQGRYVGAWLLCHNSNQRPRMMPASKSTWHSERNPD